MAPFVPPFPPIVPDEPEDAPSVLTPKPEPLVGFESPWAPADAENRDRILDWWRSWWLRVFFPWIRAWVLYWYNQWVALIAKINEWMAAAGQYITDYAVAGNGWRVTDTPIADTGTTEVVVDPLDADHRPLVVGDLIADTTPEKRFGIVVEVIDETHGVVQYVSTLPEGPVGPQGPPGPIESIVAGTNISIDDTDPQNPVISAIGGGGGSSTLYGTYAARPLVGTVADGTSYVAYDVAETYLAQAGVWRVIGGASELAYAQTQDTTLTTNSGTTDVFIPGLLATFIAGERPVMLKGSLRLSQSAATSTIKVSFYIGDVDGSSPVARGEFFAGTPSTTWQTFFGEVRAYSLTPGKTYTVTVAIARIGGTGNVLHAADEPFPSYLEVVSL